MDYWFFGTKLSHLGSIFNYLRSATSQLEYKNIYKITRKTISAGVQAIGILVNWVTVTKSTHFSIIFKYSEFLMSAQVFL